MELYFLDNGSLVIVKPTSIQLVEEVEIVRTIGCHRFSGLSGKEVYAILVENELSRSEDSNRTEDKEDK